MNPEGSLPTWSHIQAELCVVSLSSSLERCYAFCVFIQSAESKILESNDTTILNTSKIHAVVPYVEIILHPSLVRHVACYSS